MRDFARLSLREVFEALDTSPDGLTSVESERRLRKYGPNVLMEKKRIPVVYSFFSHLKDLFSLLLIFACVLAAIGGMLQLSIIIFAIVLVNAILSLFQEWRAEKAMKTLKNWIPEYAKVIRDGELRKILIRELVPGDVIILEEGDRVPADARLIEAFDLWTNNVPLTGESELQPRTVESSELANGAYLESPNLVFMSTSVAKGRGKAVVYATGMNTRFGRIAGLSQEIAEELSPLQREIAHTARYDFILALIVGGVFFLASLLWLHLDFIGSVLFMIGVMVACVPEGLQVTVSSALAINVLKMVKENVLVKRLSAVQTLGSVTIICTDKTGTITKGEMTVRKIWVKDKVVEVSGIGYTPSGDFTISGKPLEKSEAKKVEKLLKVSALCNNAKIDPPSDGNASWNIIGDPTDGALLVAALKYGLNIQNMLAQEPIIRIMPFDSKSKKMATIHKAGDKIFVYTKGAPRSIISICNRVYVGDETEDLTQENLFSVERKIREFADEGLRVIAVAYKELTKNEFAENTELERDMILVGLAAMKDPPRPEVKEAVSLAKQAGIKTVIITGDYGPTAQAIAEEVGIVEKSRCRIIRGADLDRLGDEAIIDAVKRWDVIFARVSPEQKLRIVRVLRQHGEVVAVTGDGANDAPSLKEADIGISMGISGTDIAKEVADMVLLDDSFASIVKAVESGRTIYENIRKFIIYVFSHNWAELIPYVLYALLGIPLPLLVVQVLAIDLGIDVIPSLALSREPPEPGIMQEPPRSVKERLFTAKVFLRSLYIGVIIAAGAMFGCLNAWFTGGWCFGMHLPPDSPVYIKGVTMTFAGIVVAQIGNVLACRTNKTSVFKTSLTSNKWIWIGIIAQFSLLSIMVYKPLLQKALGTTALSLNEWLFLITLALTVFFAEEIRKFFARKLSK
ncbi:MAG: cation-transporting P-type ATPase [Candidatus Bathyarchaeia archaeon]